MRGQETSSLVLALYPSSRGFAFVLLEDQNTPLEWGIKWIKGTQRHKKAVAEMDKLVERFRPDVIVVEDKSHYRRTTRIRKLYRAIEHLASSSFIDIQKFSKKEVQQAFGLSGSKTKWDVAKEVSLRMKSLEHKLPAARKSWQGEDPRQSLFDATALAITYFRKILEAYKSETKEKEE